MPDKEILVCTEKFMVQRGYKEICAGYRVQDEKGELSNMTANELKYAIWDGRVEVLNLKLTANYRLIQRKHLDVHEEIKITWLD